MVVSCCTGGSLEDATRTETVFGTREVEHKRVAIACQGGGSHTAFTGGVLKRLLRAEELVYHGEARVEEFLAALAFEDAWRGEDPDAELVSSAPFPGRGPHEGGARIRSFVTECLAEGVRVDLPKKQVARDGVAWTVRADTGGKPGTRAGGVVEAEFREGKIKALRLRVPAYGQNEQETLRGTRCGR